MDSGALTRFKAVRKASLRKPKKRERPEDQQGKPLKVSEYFASNALNLEKMSRLLPKDVFLKLKSTVESGKKLDAEIAKTIAETVKQWAIGEGVTHFCHWFQPQTGATAEKHDSFLSFDENGRPIETFSASQLIQSEPDASSFPSGGMRTTFEARGYTAWDPSSPIFIMESENGKTLCIPSVFISYTGHALDKKTGHLRSIEALSKRAVALLNTLGESRIKRVVSSLGPEQEYFLIDSNFFALRPDLVMSGRTLVGSAPPRGQQLEDHYFGSIPTRVLAFMCEVEQELYKLGVPVKTRHNEVAPSQFEMAPVFSESNIAIDHNQIVMETLRKVARRHNYKVLFHEKPFAELNGNGKHCNWSLMVKGSGESFDGENLLDPGSTPQENLRFLLFLVATLKGVHKHSGLLRAAIASSGNDHRLGANEAPPAIISVFLGETLSGILDKIEASDSLSDSGKSDEVIKLGVSHLPRVLKDNTDRNRTSPFAFTGNKFEFRAVGGAMSTSMPMTILNAVVAEALEEINEKLIKKLSSAKSKESAIMGVIREVIKETKSIRFEGNNYSEEWIKEAERRGLPHLRKTPEALEQLVSSQAKELMASLGIFNEEELISRFNVRIERYVKSLVIEAQTLKGIVDTQVLPTSYRYHRELCDAINSAKSAGVPAPQAEMAGRLSNLVDSLQKKRTEFEGLLNDAEKEESDVSRAKKLAHQILPAMENIRATCDELEEIISDDYWPLPKYREMLFLAQ